MNENKTAELMVEAFLKSGLSASEAVEQLKEAEKSEHRKEAQLILGNLIFRHLPAVAMGFLLFIVLATRI